MSTTQEQRSTTMQEPRPQGSLVRRGRAGDTSAIATMLAPFLAEDEHVLVAQYLGIQGMWGLGVSSFAAVTDQRVTTIRVHPFGAVEYQDGALEHINSGVVLQPSRFGLYAIIVLLALVTVGLSLLVTPWVGRAYYRFKKSGDVIWIREGVSIYMQLANEAGGHARLASSIVRDGAITAGPQATFVSPSVPLTSPGSVHDGHSRSATIGKQGR